MCAPDNDLHNDLVFDCLPLVGFRWKFDVLYLLSKKSISFQDQPYSEIVDFLENVSWLNSEFELNSWLKNLSSYSNPLHTSVVIDFALIVFQHIKYPLHSTWLLCNLFVKHIFNPLVLARPYEVQERYCVTPGVGVCGHLGLSFRLTFVFKVCV
jgi:hypothetical protein